MAQLAHYLQSLPDGWSIYLWLVFAGGLLLVSIFWLRWAAKHSQFDEDIKYVLFSDDDKDRMTPEDYAKMQEVKAYQMELRDKYLKEKAAMRAAHHRRHAKR